MDSTLRKFCKDKKANRSLNTQGKNECKENKLKTIKGPYNFKMGLSPIQAHLPS